MKKTMPFWTEKMICHENKRGRYGKSIGYCGIYGVNDGKETFKCRDCGTEFREGKPRRYPIQENKIPLPSEDYAITSDIRKRRSGQ